MPPVSWKLPSAPVMVDSPISTIATCAPAIGRNAASWTEPETVRCGRFTDGPVGLLEPHDAQISATRSRRNAQDCCFRVVLPHSIEAPFADPTVVTSMKQNAAAVTRGDKRKECFSTGQEPVGRTSDHPRRQILPVRRPLPAVLDCLPSHMSGVPSSAFHTTSWTLVLAASGDAAADSTDALTRLCQTYWHPVYAFIRRRGYDP